jgi:hypothetical protein
MTDLPALLRDEDRLRQAFAAGLGEMLARHPGLGVFILVLANAGYDPAIHARLAGALAARFREHAQAMRETLRAGRQPDDAPDDVLVFLKLMALGLDGLPPTAFRQAGDFQLQFNLLRALRPPRMAGARVERVFQPFDPDGFNFNRPFLRREILWEGALLGRDVRLLYNKFPFAPLHGLLVIEPEANKPQFLAHDDHQLAWALCEAAGEGMPGFGLGYNSYGAYASVNHQHFQQFCLPPDARYPVEDPHWRHNGGNRDYPLACHCLRDANRAWQALAELHERNRAYNLLYRPGRLYLLPRRFQGDYVHSAWTGGFAWSELAGAVTTFNPDDYASLDEAAVCAELSRLQIPDPGSESAATRPPK